MVFFKKAQHFWTAPESAYADPEAVERIESAELHLISGPLWHCVPAAGARTFAAIWLNCLLVKELAFSPQAPRLWVFTLSTPSF